MAAAHLAVAGCLLLTAAARHGQGAESAPALDPTVGSISGMVRFEGKAPEGERFDLAPAEKALCGLFKRALPFEVGKGGALRGAVVFLAEPVPAVEAAVLPEGVPLTMRTCEWLPHVLDATVGQALVLVNQDAAPLQAELRWRGADAAADPARRPRTLYAPGKGQQVAVVLRAPGIIDVDCAGCRSWSQAEVQVFDHRFHDTTDERGAFAIHHVPPGNYTLLARGRTLGEASVSVTVVAGRESVVNLVLPARPPASAPAPAAAAEPAAPAAP